MSTLQQLREGVNHAWDTVLEGWQKLYRRAAGAITRFTPGEKGRDERTTTEEQDLVLRNSGWGVLAAEVFDDDDKVVVRLEAPGMEKDDFDLQVIDGYLIVRGEKQIEKERNEGQYHISDALTAASSEPCLFQTRWRRTRRPRNTGAASCVWICRKPRHGAESVSRSRCADAHSMNGCRLPRPIGGNRWNPACGRNIRQRLIFNPMGIGSRAAQSHCDVPYRNID